jgi:hypothetical protein
VSALHLAAKWGFAERVLLMLKLKGNNIASSRDSYGRYPAYYMAYSFHKSISLYRVDLIVPTLRNLLEPEAVKTHKTTLDYVHTALKENVERHTSSYTPELKQFAVACAKLLAEVTKMLKQAH